VASVTGGSSRAMFFAPFHIHSKRTKAQHRLASRRSQQAIVAARVKKVATMGRRKKAYLAREIINVSSTAGPGNRTLGSEFEDDLLPRWDLYQEDHDT